MVLKQNYKSCSKFVNWCHTLNLKEEQFFHSVEIHPASNGDMEPLQYILNIQEQEELLKELQACDPEYVKKIYNIPKEYSKCNVGKHSIHINNNGVVYPCPGFMVEIGNIYEKAYREIWEQSETLNYLRNLKAEELDCYKCSNNKYCVSNCIGAIYNWNKHTSLTCSNEQFCKMKREQIVMLKKCLQLKC